MDRISRLIAAFLLLLSCVAPAQAESVWAAWYGHPQLKFATWAVYGASRDAVCVAAGQRLTAESIYTWTYSAAASTTEATAISDGVGNCIYYRVHKTNGTNPGTAGTPFGKTTLQDCAAGQTRNLAGTCEDPPCPNAGTVEGDGTNAYESNSLSSTGSVCIGGCEWKGGGVVPRVCANGKCYTFGPFTATGAQCTGSPATSDTETPPTDAKCVAKGQCPGTVNGTTVCVPCSSTESDKTTQTDKVESDGGTTSTKTTSKTTCEGASCTTSKTTTTTKGDGTSTTETETTTEPKQDYCQKNPTATECKEDDESTWEGSCTSSFVCDGDAVQCAQARAGWEAACALQTDQSNSMVLKAKTALGQDGLGDNDPREASSTFSLAGYINGRTYGPSGGGCVADYSFSYGGRSLTIPFSQYCTVLAGMGVAGNAITMIIAIGIVFGGNRRGVD